MSLIHWLWVGHFGTGPDGGVAATRTGPGEPYRPVVTRPLAAADVAAAVRVTTGGAADQIPDDWSCWLTDGYLVCDRYTHHPREVEFIARLVEQTGAALCERFVPLPLAEWLAGVRLADAAA